MVTPPPSSTSGQLTANTEPEKLSPSTDPLTLPAVDSPMLSRDNYGPSEPMGSTILPPSEGVTPESLPAMPGLGQSGDQSTVSNVPALDLPAPTLTPPPMQIPPTPPAVDATAAPMPASTSPAPDTTLSELEQQLHSSHIQDSSAPAPQPASDQPFAQPPAASDNIDLEKARSAVEDAISTGGIQPLEPIHALNAQPLPLNSQSQDAGVAMPPQNPAMAQPASDPGVPPMGQLSQPPAGQPQFGMPLPEPQAQQNDPNSPPPVPPPMMPPMPPYQQ